MNKQETLKILALIKIAYPNAYSKFSDNELEQVVALWEMQFKDYNFEDVAIAVNTFISRDLSGFAPTIAQVKNTLLNLTCPSKSDDEIWLPIQKALSNSIYNSEEEYAKLPTDIQKSITPSQLKEWAMCSDDELPFIRKEAISEYRVHEGRNNDYQLLSSKARDLLESSYEPTN